MTLPLVSVCIPTYQGERFIERTLESVLIQTYSNIELIISDHESQDSTVNLVRDCLHRSSQKFNYKIATFSREKTPAENWENAVALAAGKYVKVLGQDDLLLPNCIETEVTILEASQQSVLVFGPRSVIGPNGKRVIGRHSQSTPGEFRDVEIARRVLKHGTNIVGEPCCVMFTKQAKDLAGTFEGDYLVDLRMWMKILRHGSAVAHGQVLSSFRIGNGTWTSLLKNQQWQEFREFAVELNNKYSLVSHMSVRKVILRAKVLSQLRTILIKYAVLTRK